MSIAIGLIEKNCQPCRERIEEQCNDNDGCVGNSTNSNCHYAQLGQVAHQFADRFARGGTSIRTASGPSGFRARMPRGLIRHSSLKIPTVKLSWELVPEQEALAVQSDSHPDPIYNPEAILVLIYTSGTTGHPKGVVVTHANILANVDHLNYWMPYREGSVHLHAAPIFHILDIPFMLAAPAFGASQVTIPKFSPESEK